MYNFLLASKERITGIKVINVPLTFVFLDKCQNWIMVLGSLKIETHSLLEEQIIYTVSQP
jgi:hypothetical protein